MSPVAAGLILAAAVAHATWNLFSKQAAAAGAVLFLWLFAACAMVLYAPVVIATVLLSRPHLAPANWLFLAGTGCWQVGYFLVLQRGYRLGDLSVVYPVGRGTGALLAAVAGVVLLHEHPGAITLAGGALLVTGIVLIALPARPRSAPPGASGAGPPRLAAAVGFALLTGLFIASYTLWDKYAVATLRTPAVLQGYACFPLMTAAFGSAALRNRPGVGAVWARWRLQVLGTALLAPLAYMLVLAALSFTAVSVVAPAREVSVLLGVLAGGRLLGEGNTVLRLIAAAAIVAGIVAIALR